MRLTMGLLLTVVFAVILITVMYYITSSPQCDDLANTTGFNIKYAVDEVADPNFPYWEENSMPTDLYYYKTAEIRLCQRYDGSPFSLSGIYESLMKLTGGEPEYQIYYEKFPTSAFSGSAIQKRILPVGRWSEAYPWSSGAGSTWLFWTGISYSAKILSYVGKLSPAYMTKFAMSNFMGKIGASVDLSNHKILQYFVSPSLIMKRIKDEISDYTYMIKFLKISSPNRKITYIAEELNKMQIKELVKGLGNSGFLKEHSSGLGYERIGNKIVINDKNVVLTIEGFKNFDLETGNIYSDDDKVLIIYQPGFGELDPEKANFSNIKIADIGSIDPDTGRYDSEYVAQIIKPTEFIENLYNELSKSTSGGDIRKAKQLKEFWDWSDETGELLDPDNIDDVLRTSYGSMLLEMGFGTFKENLESYEEQGIRTTNTVLLPDELFQMADALKEVSYDPDIKEVAEIILGDEQNGLMDRIRYITDKKNPSYDTSMDYLVNDEYGIYNMRVGNPVFSLFYEEMGINVYIRVADLIWLDHIGEIDSIAMDGISEDTLLGNVTSLNNFEKINFTDDQINDIYNELYTDWENIGKTDRLDLLKEMFENYWLHWGKSLNKKTVENGETVINPDEWAINDIGVFIGLFKQSPRSPVPLPEIFRRFSINRLKRINPLARSTIKTNLKVAVTPTSGLGKAIFLEKYSGCKGNSICVYSHGQQLQPEYPFYLAGEAKEYFLRSWRPVNVWNRYAGYTAFIKWVPPHPRFYVVGPCYAKARVWKTKYNGEKTIFVYPEKYDMNGTASNYCYADEDLINAYTWVWAAADVAEVLEFATIKVGKEIAEEAVEKTLREYSDEALEKAIKESGVEVTEKSMGKIGKAVKGGNLYYAKQWLINLIDKSEPSGWIRFLGELYFSWPLPPFSTLSWQEMVAITPEIHASRLEELKTE